MTVSTVMQLQKHQPGSRRFTILVGDSQGQQHIAVMTGQMLAGEVGLQLRITYGGKQLGHRTPKPPVRQEKIRHLKNKVRDAFLSQILGTERLGNLPSDAPHLHFQLLLLHIPARNAEGGTIAEAVILAENHPRIQDRISLGVYGYIEAKGPSNEPFDTTPYRDQINRYLTLGHKLIITDGIDFV